MPKGIFIAFEGGEGSGKTTQSSLLAQYLQSEGYEVCLTREPGSEHEYASPIQAAIRSLMLSPPAGGAFPVLDARAETFLFMADRCQHQTDVILPAINRGEIVICDRYADSTLAYQFEARGVEIAGVRPADKLRFAMQGLEPDLVIILGIDPDKGLARVKERGEANSMDSQPIDFHQKVLQYYKAREGYKDWRPGASSLEVIDAALPVDEVASRVRTAAEKLIGGMFRGQAS